MKQRILVFIYFLLASFFVYVLLIMGALSAMDRSSKPWEIDMWITVFTPPTLAALFIYLGIRQHKIYAKTQFKTILKPRKYIFLIRILIVCMTTVAGFFIVWGITLLVSGGELFTAISALLIGMALTCYSFILHRKYVK
jgi:hypothetical protein